jgi:hypothetical protein
MNHKAYSSYATYGTYESTRKHSQLERINVFPYPFYFEGNPFSDEPIVNPRRAGWSPQVLKPEPVLKPDPYPNHCFQAACNTRYTDELPPASSGSADAPSKAGKPAGATKPAGTGLASKPVVPSPSDRCALKRCINVYR